MSDTQAQFATTGSRQSAASTNLIHGSLFSGVGGIDLGFSWAGIKTVWQVESDPFARLVLEKHFPGVKKFTDVRECGKQNLESVSIISGGFPCQDESISGKERGLGTSEEPSERSGLWYQQHRIIRELRPPWVLIENVLGLLRSGDIDIVLSGMEEIGYTCWSLLLAAEILGAPHKRERVWILCHRNDAHDSRDFGAAKTGELKLPPHCQQEMGKAKERWDYWRHELSRGGFSPMISTPPATEILEEEWGAERYYLTGKGRMRKRCKTGTDSSMSWVQEMAARAVKQGNPRLEPTPEACEEMMGYPASYTDLGHKEPEAVAYARIRQGVYGIPDWEERLKALGNAVVPQIPMHFGCFIQQFESQFALPAHTGSKSSKEDKMSKNSCAQDMSGLQTGENSLPVTVGTTSAREGAKKAKGRKRGRQCRGQADQKGEMISLLSPSPVTELPPEFDFIASKTDEEKIEYIQSVLARSEDEAIAVIAPALRFYGTAGAVVEAYLPLILEVKKHLCRPGRPKADPTTGERRKTWEEICKENFHITIRRMQQILASLMVPRLPGKGGDKNRRPAVDRKDYERAKQVAALARSLAEAVVKEGLGGKFPEAVEILKLANIPVPEVQPAANRHGVDKEPDWKNILAQLADTLEQCGDRLPVPAMDAVRPVKRLLYGRTDPQQLPPGKPRAAATKRGGVQKDRKDNSAPCAVPAEEVPSKDARKPPAPVKPKVCPPALSPEEEEHKHGTLGTASGHPGRRQGDFVLKENGIWECEPELGMCEAEEIRNAQPGQLPPRMATAARPCRVKKRVKGDIVQFLVIRDGDRLPEEVFDTESEAKALCERLNMSLVAGIVPQETNPQSAAQSAA